MQQLCGSRWEFECSNCTVRVTQKAGAKERKRRKLVLNADVACISATVSLQYPFTALQAAGAHTASSGISNSQRKAHSRLGYSPEKAVEVARKVAKAAASPAST